MGLGTWLKQWSYRKRVREWPELPGRSLDVDLRPPAVNGIRFGSALDEARKLGRPVVSVISSTSDVRLDFPNQGVTLEYEEEKLTYMGIIIRPEDYFGRAMKPAMAALCHNTRLILSPAITAEKLIAFLGSAQNDDSDEYDRVLTHVIDGTVVETEFTPNNELSRVNLFGE
jgi:hypothetical protein